MEIVKTIEKFGNGNYVEVYHKKGNRFYYHREDGPAKIWYNSYNLIYYEQYWVNDEELSKEEWEQEYGWKLHLKGTPMESIYK